MGDSEYLQVELCQGSAGTIYGTENIESSVVDMVYPISCPPRRTETQGSSNGSSPPLGTADASAIHVAASPLSRMHKRESFLQIKTVAKNIRVVFSQTRKEIYRSKQPVWITANGLHECFGQVEEKIRTAFEESLNAVQRANSTDKEKKDLFLKFLQSRNANDFYPPQDVKHPKKVILVLTEEKLACPDNTSEYGLRLELSCVPVPDDASIATTRLADKSDQISANKSNLSGLASESQSSLPVEVLGAARPIELISARNSPPSLCLMHSTFFERGYFLGFRHPRGRKKKYRVHELYNRNS